MNVERRRVVLEAVVSGEDATPADRLRAIEALGELDRIEGLRPTPSEVVPHIERDPNRIEKILELALLHVGPQLIEERAEARARELLSHPRSALPGGPDDFPIMNPSALPPPAHRDLGGARRAR